MLKFLTSDVFKIIKLLIKKCGKYSSNFNIYESINTEGRPVKILLSHNMSGLNKEHVMNIRKVSKNYLNRKYGENNKLIFIDNYHHYDAPENATRIWHLGRSIQQMSEADFVYFCDPKASSFVCIIEKIICLIYKKPVLK